MAFKGEKNINPQRKQRRQNQQMGTNLAGQPKLAKGYP